MPSEPSSASELAHFEIEDSLHFETDGHGMLRARISSAQCEATVYLHGAHVTAWRPKGQAPVLFLSERSEFKAGRPIRGGIPVIFPWFGPNKTDVKAPAHGWARFAEWSVESTSVGGGDIEIVLVLESATVAPAHTPCKLRLAVRCGSKLNLRLTVENLAAAPLRFEEALHTYFAISDIANVKVSGFGGTPYFDKVAAAEKPSHGNTADIIAIEGETDRVYAPTTGSVAIIDRVLNRQIVIEKTGSRSTVLWNPWIAKSAALPDFGDDEWKRMLCVETANVTSEAIELAPGATHEMTCVIGVEPTNIGGFDS